MIKKLLATFFTFTLITVSFFGLQTYAAGDNLSNGLKKISDTRYMWYDANNTPIVGWKDDYHFNNSSPSGYGYMDFGWYTDNTGMYFLNTTIGENFGKKVRGWNWIDGYCYYFDGNGRLVYNLDTATEKTNDKGQWVIGTVVQYTQGKGFVSGAQNGSVNIGSMPSAPAPTSSGGVGSTPKSEVLGYIPTTHSKAASGSSNYESPTTTTIPEGTSFKTDTLIIEAKSDVYSDYVRAAIAPYGGTIEKSFDAISTYTVKLSTGGSSSRLIEIRNALQSDFHFSKVLLDMVYEHQ